MDKDINVLISKEYNHQDANYYYLSELDYYKFDAFN